MLRAGVVQRAILTAIADIRLVSKGCEVLQATVGSMTIASLCSTTLHEDGSAHLRVVLQRADDLDYAQIAACVAERLSQLECLSGRGSSLRRHCLAPVAASASIFAGQQSDDRRFEPASSISQGTLDQALTRNPTDRILGVRDMRLASLEQRINFLLSLSLDEEFGEHLDAVICQHNAEMCPIEELDTMSLPDACCATGCEPCVWETYYRRQALERAEVSRGKRLCQLPCGDRRGDCGSASIEVAAATSSVGAPSSLEPTRLVPDEFRQMMLVARHEHAADVLLLTFAAEPSTEPSSPWHVRVRLPDLGGNLVTRSYTGLWQGTGSLELLVKIQPDGRCTQAMRRLAVGDCVLAQGVISTDRNLRERLSAATLPSAIHLLSAGSGIAPMYQVADALLARAEREAARAALRTLRTRIRFWSVNQSAENILLPSYIATLQKRSRQLGSEVHCTQILTRESMDNPQIEDALSAFGGSCATVVGRPNLQILVQSCLPNEVQGAILIICGPEGFNDAMDASAQALGYAEGNIFIRRTPLQT